MLRSDIPPTKDVLRVEALSVRLPGNPARPFGVEDVGFMVRPGETTCLVGESGSGKSLTAQSILGLLPARFERPTGRILFEGTNLLSLTADALRTIRGHRIGMIFQEPMTALNPLMRVGRQIEEVLRIHSALGARERRERVLASLREVNLQGSDLLDRYPHQLSGGQRQRVMIAMALVMEPTLLIADEPTTALDVTTQAQILRLIRDLQRRHGTGVLFITHDFGVVAEIADSVAVMRQGRVVEAGPAGQVLSSPTHEYTRTLLDAVPRGRVRSDAPVTSERPALRVIDLSKTYHRRRFFGRGTETRALSNVSLQIAAGEILGIVGESGSGKSTVARCVARLVDPDSGSVEVAGEDFGRLSGAALRASRRNLQFVFQDPYSSLNPRRMVGDLIAQGPINFGEGRAAALKRAETLLELVGLDAGASRRYPGEFSGGQRQRICIARALALEPKVLIADEAVSALDVSVQAQIVRLIDALRRRLGIAVLFITHDLRVAAELCDRLVVMQNGVIVEQGSCREVLLTPREPYTRSLIESLPGKALSLGAGV